MWICSQIGAREHYAVPRALHQSGRLAALYTDFWAGRTLRQAEEMGNRRLKLGALRSLAARYHPGLSGGWAGQGQSAGISGRSATVISWNLQALWWERILRKQEAEGRSQYDGFIEVGRRFATRIREDLKRRNDLGPDSIFFAYDTGALEAMEWCRDQGLKCVLNQMDPNRVEVEVVRAEEQRWPGWALSPIQVPEIYFVRREKEWALADRVLVNSDFSRQALVQQGVAAEKLVVVPLCYEAESDGETPGPEPKLSSSSSQPSVAPLRVLFLGQVILRKGIQYLIEAARLLVQENIRFEVVGPVGITAEAVASAPQNMTFRGRAPRNEAGYCYRQADVFVLPTLSDGFALTQIEAMANGLPVIATPCCGEVVSNGVDGFIVPPRDAGALAQTLQRYLSEPALLKQQQAAALIKSGMFTPDRLAANLQKLEAGLFGKKP